MLARKSALRVGLTFNVRRIDSASDDVEAEFDPPHTIAAVAAAHECMIVTDNERDFAGLQIVNPMHGTR